MYVRYKDGWIEVISGCMFAGKTEELIRRINMLSFANKKIQIFKPLIDNRYEEEEIVSHNNRKIKAIRICNAQQLIEFLDNDTEVIAIDEIQFFTSDILIVLEQLADQGKRIIVAGLDKDFRGEPFKCMPELLTRAEFVTKLEAICVKCHSPATRTQRIINGLPASYYDPIVLIGANEFYEARCRHCHIVNDYPQTNIKENKNECQNPRTIGNNETSL
ncbi:thymidine kinase [Spiroplasma endosymbiont of Eupeodes luniger]|uniref:thymidine kinase n=1 Tax=Spiroplasma endosymbiont of Eupeodes luniger TaxID=3066300 RepID=UPI0030D462B7